MNFPPPTARQARVIWFALTALAVTLTLVIVGALVWGMGRIIMALSPVLWPIAVAGVVAILLDPVVDWLSARKVPRLRAILLVFGAAAFLALGVVGSVIPRAVVEARDLALRVPHYVEVGQRRIEDLINRPPASLLGLLPESWQAEWRARVSGRTPAGGTNAPIRVDSEAASPRSGEAAEGGGGGGGFEGTSVATNAVSVPGARGGGEAGSGPAFPTWWSNALDPKALKTAGGWLGTMAAEAGRWTVGQFGRLASWFGVLAGLALIPVYAFYFLLERSEIQKRWTDYLPVSDSYFKDELVWLLRNINDALIVFFRGQVLVAVCDGILYGLGFLVIGLPYALLLGLVAMVLTIVPFLGAIVTCASALAIAVIQFGDWQHPLLVMVVFLVVQTIEGWVIQPKIIGDRVGLHPVTIIIALLVGTTLMGGLLGGLLAIPATAVLRALMFRYIWRAGRGAGVETPDKTL